MREFGQIQAVLFDLGGTLVDYPVPSWPVMAGQCARGVYGFLVRPASELPPPAASVPGPAEAHARRRRASPETALPHRIMMGLRRMVRSLSGRTLPRIAEACARPLVAPGHLFEDSLPTVQALRDRGYRLGLVSNTPWGTPDYLWTRQLERFNLASAFDVSVFSSDVGFRKPDRRIFQVALDHLGLCPEHALFVGDSPEADIVGAQRVGLHTALIARAGHTVSGTTPTPNLRVDTLTQLLEHLPGRAENG